MNLNEVTQNACQKLFTLFAGENGSRVPRHGGVHEARGGVLPRARGEAGLPGGDEAGLHRHRRTKGEEEIDKSGI